MKEFGITCAMSTERLSKLILKVRNGPVDSTENINNKIKETSKTPLKVRCLDTQLHNIGDDKETNGDPTTAINNDGSQNMPRICLFCASESSNTLELAESYKQL